MKINPTKLIAVFFLFFYLSLSFFYRNILPNGDEVHYLIATISVVHDHDLWLENNYKNRDYEQFNAKKFDDHLTYTGRDGHEYPIHGVAYPFLIAPAYALGGKLGVLIFNAIIGTILVTEIFTLTRRITKSLRLSLIMTLTSGISLPLAHFSVLIFTETFGALSILLLFKNTVFKPKHYLVVPAITTILPWINVRFLPISVVFLLFWFIQNKKYLYRYVWGLTPIISVISYFLFLKITSGTFNPSQPFEQLNVSTTTGNIFGNILNQLIDRQYGLLVYSPIFLLSIPGFYFWFKEKKMMTTVAFISILVYMLPVLRFSDWQGGYTPPARYIDPIIPLIIPAVIFYLKNTKNKFIYLLSGMASVWGIGAFLINLSLPPSNGFIYINGISPFLWYVFLKTRINVHSLFPSFYPSWNYNYLHFLWGIFITFCVVFLFKLRKNND